MNDLNLKDIDYFKNINIDYVLDSLTKVISRQYIVEIAQNLIRDNIPFTLMIIDLDNFKQINDSFGHLTGDFILNKISTGILELLQKRVYIGRYGGDEFLLLIPNVSDYDEIHVFLEELYQRDRIFRKYYNDGKRDIYVTSTAGCAVFPNDATKFDELFTKADKALYRGKTKGRNCYIIYVESKHADIVIQEKVNGSLIEKFKSIKRIFEIYNTKEEKLKGLVDLLYAELHCTASYLLLPNKKYVSNFYSKQKGYHILVEPHLDLLLNGDTIFYDTPLTKYKEKDPALDKYLTERAIQSVIVSKIKMGDYHFGYIVLYENSISRVWQEPELLIVMYASSLLELDFKDYK